MTIVRKSFNAFLVKGTSRSTDKLKPLHGSIASDIANRLGSEYTLVSKGFEEDKEQRIEGRYFDKRVDIAILKDNTPIAAIGVKFVMQNYAQNANNYFENMLGETANLRASRIPYFQIFIILDKIPYYDKDEKITRWEEFSTHYIQKYIKLSCDNVDQFYHTPNKTLIYLVKPPFSEDITTLGAYLRYHRGLQNVPFEVSNVSERFGDAVIINDYEKFREKIYHTVEAR